MKIALNFNTQKQIQTKQVQIPVKLHIHSYIQRKYLVVIFKIVKSGCHVKHLIEENKEKQVLPDYFLNIKVLNNRKFFCFYGVRFFCLLFLRNYIANNNFN